MTRSSGLRGTAAARSLGSMALVVRSARFAAGVAMLVAATLAAAPPAAALCAGIPDARAELQRGGVAFVGTATYVTGERWATFHVEDVWSGDDLPEWLEVAGTTTEKPRLLYAFANVGSTDRWWIAGTKYLVFPQRMDGRLVDGNCSGTTVWRDGLADLRPATAHAPVPAPAPLSWVPVAAGAILLLALPFVWLAAARPRR